MSYRINRTDGELLVDLTDGNIDTTSTNLTLIGKNYQGFGELVNENFVKLLENFASTAQPSNPVTGQVWYDKQDQRLKVFNGTIFKSASGTFVQSSQPTNLTTGDLWVDNSNNKLYIFDGTDLTLVGPNYNAGQGKTTFEAASQIDSINIQRQILKLFLGGILIGIYSPLTFYIPTEFAITGLSVDESDINNPKRQRLYKGFNIVNQAGETGTDGFWWRGTASNAKFLLDDANNKKSSNDFMPRTATAETTGNIIIRNSEGLAIGVGTDTYAGLRILGNDTYLENFRSNADFNLRTRVGNSVINVLNVDTDQYKMSLFKDINYSSIQPKLDVTGDVNVVGNLTVGGNTTYLDTTTLRVEDKNIELGYTSTGTQGDDTAVDGGGLTLKSSQGSKDLSWVNSTDSWTCNQHFNLTTITNPEYKINGTTVLTATGLGGQVVSSSLTSVGTLTELTVDYVKIDSATIERVTGTGTGLNITARGPLVVDSQRITSVADPIAVQDVATKNYVDNTLANQAVYISFDASGIITDTANPAGSATGVRDILQSIVSAGTKSNGTVAKVVATTTTFANATFTLDISTGNSTVLQKSFATVRNSSGGTTSVVQDIAVNTGQANQTASLSVTTNRFLYTFTGNGSTWSYSTVATL